ncbi:MAG TPA: T9SS type A sorting domain-containing protein [Candidatus Paceibacterota bacterium]|nr:T9SS type A sorting domain-containing protein [Candidatus Paceibacterota bacterium]
MVLTWTTTGASYCYATQGAEGWTGVNYLHGSYYVGALYSPTTFCLTAVDNFGNSVTECVTVNVDNRKYVYLPHRVAGAGTNISVPLTSGASSAFQGFEMRIQSNGSLKPNYFELGWKFYPNWMYASNTYNSYFRVAAVGNTVNILGRDLIGTLYFKVSESAQGQSNYPWMEFFDSATFWSITSGGLQIINIPPHLYGDMNSDLTFNISDGIAHKNLLGTWMSDELRVRADLNGNGEVNTFDTYLVLSKIVNPEMIFPIFDYNYFPNLTPILMTWEKLPDGQWGLFSDEKITNFDLIGSDFSSLNADGWTKIVDNQLFFVNQLGIENRPILISPSPVPINGTANEGRKIIISTPTGVEEGIEINTYSLSQNYPNPFNPSTTISFTLAQAASVELKVYDVLGNEVATLVNEEKPAGKHEVKFDATSLSSGLYIYKIVAGNFIETKKMVLMK